MLRYQAGGLDERATTAATAIKRSVRVNETASAAQAPWAMYISHISHMYLYLCIHISICNAHISKLAVMCWHGKRRQVQTVCKVRMEEISEFSVKDGG